MQEGGPLLIVHDIEVSGIPIGNGKLLITARVVFDSNVVVASYGATYDYFTKNEPTDW